MDREKVIKAIECCVVNHTRCFDDNDKLCPYFSTKVYMCEIELLRDALALLKEQEADMIALKNAYKELAEKGSVIVRCKDCEHATMTADGKMCKYCEMDTDDFGYQQNAYHDANWFCADGKRRDSDA